MGDLSLHGLRKSYGAFHAVDGIDLTLAEGEFLSLLGPSGCGKTTTLRMIAGFVEPTDGTITLNGKVISSAKGSLPPEKRGMSMIFQSYAVWPNMTVAENVGFGLTLRKMPAHEIRARVGEILEVVRLSHLADRYPAELSGGQQQRVSLARAVAVRPKVLLLDEPLSNLDAHLREEMRFEIKRLHDEFRITSVYVTHDQSEAMVTSDRIAVMNAGRIEQVDAPHRLYSLPKTEFVAKFIGRTNLLKGKAGAEGLDFAGFTLPRGVVASPRRAGEEVTLSIRPQALRLDDSAPAGLQMPVSVTSRVFTGETWDYQLRTATGLQLRMVTPPTQMHAVGHQAMLSVRAEDLVVIGD